MPEWLNNPWIISLVSVVLTLALEPIGASALRWLRSLRGPFSGTYVAITIRRHSNAVVVETVSLRHHGRNLRATIAGALFAAWKNRELTDINDNTSRFQAAGAVEDRTLVLSYFSVQRGVKGAGSITLKANQTGDVFQGEQTELEQLPHEQVRSSPCIWAKIEATMAKSTNRQRLIETVSKILKHWPKGSVEPYSLLIHGAWGAGKTSIAMQIQKALADQLRTDDG